MAASTETGPLVAVHRFIEAFDDDDVARCQAVCAEETAIVDDFPPYQCRGHAATTTWYRDMAGMAGQYGMSDWSVTLDPPRHSIVSDGLAYVVVPVAARWLEHCGCCGLVPGPESAVRGRDRPSRPRPRVTRSVSRAPSPSS